MSIKEVVKVINVEGPKKRVWGPRQRRQCMRCSYKFFTAAEFYEHSPTCVERSGCQTYSIRPIGSDGTTSYTAIAGGLSQACARNVRRICDSDTWFFQPVPSPSAFGRWTTVGAAPGSSGLLPLSVLFETTPIVKDVFNWFDDSLIKKCIEDEAAFLKLVDPMAPAPCVVDCVHTLQAPRCSNRLVGTVQ